MIQQGSPPRARTRLWVVGLLDVAGIVLWLLAFSGVLPGGLPPHPWVFVLFGLAACVVGMAAIVLTAIAWLRSSRSRRLAIALASGGALPPILAVILALVTS